MRIIKLTDDVWDASSVYDSEREQTLDATLADLSEDAQAAGEKADSAVQEVHDSYRTATAQDEIDEAQDAEIADVKSAINNLEDICKEITDWSSGYIESTSSDVGTQISMTVHDSSAWTHTVIDCTEGDLFTISGFAGRTNRFWCFLDVGNHILGAAPPMAKYVHKLLVAPSSASKLVLQQALPDSQTAVMPNYRGLVPFVDSLTGLYENRKREVSLTWEQGNITTTDGYKDSSKHIRSRYGVTFNQGEKLIITNRSMDYCIAVYGSKQNTFKLFQTSGVFVNGCGQIEVDDWTYSYQVVLKNRPTTAVSTSAGQYVSAEIINNVYTANDVVNKSLVGFSRSYAYANPYLDFLRKTLQADGTLVDSTTNVIVEIPNHGRVEVKSDAPVAGFKIAKVYNNAVTYLVEDWSYYTYRYVGDNQSKYFAIIANAADPQTVILPDNAAYYVGVYTFADEGKDVSPSTLMGKHVAFIGDSITQGRFENFGSSVNNCVMKPFGALIAEHIGDKNYGQFGIGGALVYDSDWKSLYRNCGKVTGYDVIFVCGGSNDFGQNITENDFKTAFDHVVTTLIANNSGSDIVVCSPVYSSSRAGKNSQSLYLYDYALFEKEIAESHNLKFIDMYTPTNNSRFAGYCSDGLHPNEMGHRLMADIILAKYDELS